MPKGVYERVKNQDVSEIVPRGEFKIKEETMSERKYSDEKDLKGSGHPLCLGCNHREDMHHSWILNQRIETYRDFQRNDQQRIVVERDKNYDGNKPCQHACKCTEYK